MPLGHEALKCCHHSQPPSPSCNYSTVSNQWPTPCLAIGGHLALGHLVQVQPKETALLHYSTTTSRGGSSYYSQPFDEGN